MLHYFLIFFVFVTEYIITFKGYYESKTRHRFIATALNNIGLQNWTIKERNNAAKKYPSDFDVIFVSL